MRNLKKVLSLALCLVMLLGMMVVGAGAADFKDASTIQYDVAAAVLDEINVIKGYEDDSFRPTEKLTRAQGAAIVYRLIMGGIDKDPEPVSTGFVDVDGNADVAWATGYIAACAQQGILSGVGGNKFEPAGELSGYAFAKMLLVALGYDAGSQGYTGTGWEANVLRDAYVRGITVDNVSVAGDITREQAAQMALQTLTATMVEQTPGVSVNGVVIPGSKATDRTGSTTKNYDNAGSGDGKLQFCELYFPSLTLANGANDDFGRATKVWKNGVKEITSIPAPAFVKYTKDMDNNAGKTQISSDLAGYTISSVAVLKNNKADGTVSSTNDIAGKTGNGKVVEVYVNDTAVTSVVTTEYQIAEITSKSAVSKTIRLSTGTVVIDGKDNKDYYETLNAMEKGDYVVVALKDGTILDLSEPEVVSGAYTKKSGSKYTVGGNEYEASEVNALTALNTVSGGNFDLYLDGFGYVLFAKAQAGGAKTDAVLLATSRDGTAKTGYSYGAKLLKTDGTVEWVDVSKYSATVNGTAESVSKVSGTFSGNSLDNKFVKYTVDDDGAYTLYLNDASVKKTDVTGVTSGDPALTGGSYTANSKTAFLIEQSDGSYKAYTGIKNVPTITSIDSNSFTLVESGIAKILVVTAANTGAVVGDEETKYVFFYKGTAEKIENVDGTTVYTYKAILDGVDTTVETVINETTMASKLGLYAGYPVNADGYITAPTATKMEVNSTATSSVLGKTGNIGAKYVDQALTLKVTDNILTLTAKSAGDIVTYSTASTASSTGAATETKYVADSFAVYRVDTTSGKAELLDAEATTLSVRAHVIITLNSDGEAAAAYVFGADAHVHGAWGAWTVDGANHKRVCAVEGCPGETHAIAFTWAEDSGSHKGTCSGANCDIVVTHTATGAFETGWTADEDNHWHACKTEGCTVKDSSTAHTGAAQFTVNGSKCYKACTQSGCDAHLNEGDHAAKTPSAEGDYIKGDGNNGGTATQHSVRCANCDGATTWVDCDTTSGKCVCGRT